MATSKLTQEEMQQLQQTQNSNRALVQELGQIALAQIELDKRQENAETFLDNLRKSEADIAKALEDKYGQGSINLETGEIITEDTIPTGTESVELPKVEKEETKAETEKPVKDSAK
tara:strand:- start:2347 stop:2694 length:348 start_codon:yes stop_codon:yes gene_type:complete